jgi:hypothetical protein
VAKSSRRVTIARSVVVSRSNHSALVNSRRSRSMRARSASPRADGHHAGSTSDRGDRSRLPRATISIASWFPWRRDDAPASVGRVSPKFLQESGGLAGIGEDSRGAQTCSEVAGMSKECIERRTTSPTCNSAIGKLRFPAPPPFSGRICRVGRISPPSLQSRVGSAPYPRARSRRLGASAVDAALSIPRSRGTMPTLRVKRAAHEVQHGCEERHRCSPGDKGR